MHLHGSGVGAEILGIVSDDGVLDENIERGRRNIRLKEDDLLG